MIVFSRAVSSRRPCAPPMPGSSTPRRECLPPLPRPKWAPGCPPSRRRYPPGRPAFRSSNAPEPTIWPAVPGPIAPAARTANSTPGAMAPQETVHGGTRPPPATVRARPHRAGRVGRLIVMVSSVVFIASATLLTRYTNNGTGWKSLLAATHGDPASPLRAMSFNILIGLVALVFLVTIISIGVHRRLPMIVVVVAALALIGYTSYLPAIGGDGLSDYGSSYWISLVAAVAMAFGGGFAFAQSGRS